MKNYNVTVRRATKRIEEAVVTVPAVSEEAARDAVRDLMDNNEDDFDWEDIEDDLIDLPIITDVQEIT